MMLMKFPNKANLERLRRVYPKGTKVRLLAMDDPQAPPVGTQGEVRGVDDAGNILVSWENGSSLSLILGTDKFERIPGEMIYGAAVGDVEKDQRSSSLSQNRDF